jgi:hypothetical protein
MTFKAILAAVALGLAASASAAHSGEATAPPTAKDTGLRYGQALGVLEVCYGSRLTDKAKALEQTYSGADLEAFKAAAASVYEAWVKVRACTNQKDPNTCKIIMDRSCQMAEAEIGPAGNAMAGVVEFLKH